MLDRSSDCCVLSMLILSQYQHAQNAIMRVPRGTCRDILETEAQLRCAAPVHVRVCTHAQSATMRRPRR